MFLFNPGLDAVISHTLSLDIFRAWENHSLDKWLPVHAGDHLGLDHAGQQQFHSHELHCQCHYESKASVVAINRLLFSKDKENNRNLHILSLLTKTHFVGVSPMTGYHTLVQHVSNIQRCTT